MAMGDSNAYCFHGPGQFRGIVLLAVMISFGGAVGPGVSGILAGRLITGLLITYWNCEVLNFGFAALFVRSG